MQQQPAPGTGMSTAEQQRSKQLQKPIPEKAKNPVNVGVPSNTVRYSINANKS